MDSRRDVGLRILYACLELVCQTFFYGIFCVLLPISSYILLKKRMKSTVNKILFSMTVSMFCLTTGYWIAAMGSLISLIKSRLLSPLPHDPDFSLPLFSALMLMNYALTDSIVIWRAWVLCKDNNRNSLILAIFLLICAFVSILITIAFQIGTTVLGSEQGSHLESIIEVTQVVNLALSFLANALATAIICLKAWLYRKELGTSFNGRTKVERVFIILVESGLVYCASGIFSIVASVIRLPHGTLGDVYTRIHVQLAAIYPAVILILVSQERTLEEGVFSNARRSVGATQEPVEAMNFVDNPALTISRASQTSV